MGIRAEAQPDLRLPDVDFRARRVRIRKHQSVNHFVPYIDKQLVQVLGREATPVQGGHLEASTRERGCGRMRPRSRPGARAIVRLSVKVSAF